MDGLVLSVAIGFRSYGGGGLGTAEVIAIISLGVMFIFTLMISLNFVRDTNAKNRIVAKQTTDQASKLESLLDDASLEEVRDFNNAKTIKKIEEHFKNTIPPEQEYLDYFIRLYHKALNFLSELEATYYLMEKNAISDSLLKSCVGGRLLREYELFFEPLLQARKAHLKASPKTASTQMYYTGTWHGIPKLIDILKELIQKGEEKPKGMWGRFFKYLKKQLSKI